MTHELLMKFDRQTRHWARFKEVGGFNVLYVPLAFAGVSMIHVSVRKARNLHDSEQAANGNGQKRITEIEVRHAG